MGSEMCIRDSVSGMNLWKHIGVLVLVAGLSAATTAVVGAQEQSGGADSALSHGTCDGLGLSVVEPISVGWESASDPVLNPSFLWAYGDVDLLWDNSVDEFWFHWYDAVPGADPYVVAANSPATSTSTPMCFHRFMPDTRLASRDCPVEI